MVPKCALGKFLLAATFLDINFVKIVRKRGGGMLRSDIITKGGVQSLTNADIGGGGSKSSKNMLTSFVKGPYFISTILTWTGVHCTHVIPKATLRL